MCALVVFAAKVHSCKHGYTVGLLGDLMDSMHARHQRA
jgi:hypothetical protein